MNANSSQRRPGSTTANRASSGRNTYLLVACLILLVLAFPSRSRADRVGNEGFRPLLQPTQTTCGQTSVAMVTGTDVRSVIGIMGTEGRTNRYQLMAAIRRLRPGSTPKVVQLNGNAPSRNAIVFIKDSSSGERHWTVRHDGVYYDPLFGRTRDYPQWMDKQFEIRMR